MDWIILKSFSVLKRCKKKKKPPVFLGFPSSWFNTSISGYYSGIRLANSVAQAPAVHQVLGRPRQTERVWFVVGFLELPVKSFGFVFRS